MVKRWDLFVVSMGFYTSSSLQDSILVWEQRQWKTMAAVMNGVFDCIFLLTLHHMALYLRVYADGRIVRWDESKSPKLQAWMMTTTWSTGALSFVNGFGVYLIGLTWDKPETALTVLSLAVKLFKILILIAIISRVLLQDHEEEVVGVIGNRDSPATVDNFKTVLAAQAAWSLLLMMMAVDISLPLFSPHQQYILGAVWDVLEIGFCLAVGVIFISERFRPNELLVANESASTTLPVNPVSQEKHSNEAAQKKTV